MEIRCSLLDCEEIVLGTAVMLAASDDRHIEWEKGFNQYNTHYANGEIFSYVLLHPICFLKIFDTFMQQEGMTALKLLVGPVGIFAEELGIAKS